MAVVGEGGSGSGCSQEPQVWGHRALNQFQVSGEA